MQADRVEMSWDEEKKKWLVRIVVGEEVIRRYCKEHRDASQADLRSAAQQTAVDEGYTVDPADITLK